MKNRKLILLVLIIIASVAICSMPILRKPYLPEDYTEVERIPNIKPDYTNTVIPPNIAPLNFKISEAGQSFIAKIYSEKGNHIIIAGKKGSIIIPQKKWKKLLAANKGKPLYFEIFSRNSENKWQKYKKITNTIANDEIDSHLVYRLMQPIYNFWKDIGIYQRNLSNFKQSLVFHGDSFANGCLNCHTFLNNTPSKMTVGIRSKDYGSATLISDNGRTYKVGTKWGYTSWHPSGRIAIYSLNKVRQFFHTNRMENRDVVDLDSAIAYYDIETRKTKTVPQLSDQDQLETYPTWSPDGKYLYFCSGPVLWQDRNKVPPDNYDKLKYDLKRISYDLKTDQWGQPETILSAKETGRSILLPRISPDGRFLAFCMCQYGCFPIYQESSDIYIMDLDTGKYNKLDINSEYSESWHSFSANSRWLAFSSKRRDGLFTRTYFSYIDETGKASKPFILPQKDPTFYNSQLKTYSVPELITAPVPINNRIWGKNARSAKKVPAEMPITGATPVLKSAEGTYQDRE